MHWKGAYKIVEKLGKVDYKINVNGTIKTFRANLLKRYVERKTEESKQVSSDNAFSVVNAAVIDLSDQNDDMPGE